MKSLIHMKELCSRSVPLEHAPGAKPFVCIGLKRKREMSKGRKEAHAGKMLKIRKHKKFQTGFDQGCI